MEEKEAFLSLVDEDTIEGPVSQEEINEGVKLFDETSTPKTRLANEIQDLANKIKKLESYLKGRNTDGVRLVVADRLTEAQVYLLGKQLEVMSEYYDILVSRYSIFDVKCVEDKWPEVEIVKG